MTISEKLSPKHLTLAFVVIVLGISATHGRRIVQNHHSLHWEDPLFFQHTRDNIHSLADCFTKRSLWPGLYRPLTTNLYYYLGEKLFRNRIEIYHIMSLVLILANALLLYHISLHFLSPLLSILPVALFTSRHSHIEVVLNSCEFQSLLAVFFSLLTVKLFILGRTCKCMPLEYLSLVTLILSFLSKETSVVTPMILMAYGLLFDVAKAWKHYIWPVVASCAFIGMSLTVFPSVGQPSGTEFSYSPLHVVLNYTGYLASFFNSLVLPVDSLAMPARALSFSESTFTIAFFIIVVVLDLCVFLFLRWLPESWVRQLRPLAFGFSFFLIANAPYVILENRLFMRYGYFGHAGLALCSASVFGLAVDAAVTASKLLPGRSESSRKTYEQNLRYEEAPMLAKSRIGLTHAF